MVPYEAEAPPPLQNPRRSYALKLRPSDNLREMFEPFYRPSAQRKLGRASLYSLATVTLETLPGPRYIYRDPQYPDVNSIQAYHDAEVHHLDRIVGHELPLLSYLQVLKSHTGWLRLHLKLGVEHDRAELASLSEFRTNANERALDVVLDIPPQDVIPNVQMQAAAKAGLEGELLVNHPAARAGNLPYYKRTVDPEHKFAQLESGRLIQRT